MHSILATSAKCSCGIRSVSASHARRIDLHRHSVFRHFSSSAFRCLESDCNSINNNNNNSSSSIGSPSYSEKNAFSAIILQSHQQTTPSTTQASQWDDPKNHQKFFEWAAPQLGVDSLEGWYRITTAQIRKLEGGYQFLRKHYNGSLQQALSSAYPDYDWIPWRFAQVSRGFWQNNTANHKRFFDWAAEQLGVAQPQDWYNIRLEQVQRLGGDGLLRKHYGSSLQRALISVYPEHDWKPWLFVHAPNGFWNQTRTKRDADASSVSASASASARLRLHREFFDWAAQQLGVATWEDWYQITADRVWKLGGGGLLLACYSNSLQNALAAVYPEHEWLPWRFSHVGRAYWKNNKASHRKFFDWAAKKLGIEQMDDWYQITNEQFRAVGGAGLLVHYDYSLPRALRRVYPEHPWQQWRFRGGGFDVVAAVDVQDLYAGRDNGLEAELRRYVEYLASKLHIEHLDDWYRAPVLRMRRMGGYGIIDQCGGLHAVLSKLYPEHPWDKERFLSKTSAKRSTQRQLFHALGELFPNANKNKASQCSSKHHCL